MKLTPDAGTRAAVLEAVAKRLDDWLDAVPHDAVTRSGTVEAAQRLGWAAPGTPQPVAAVLDDLFERIVPLGYHVRHPGFMAYIPHTAIWTAAVADMLAAALDRYCTVRVAGPGAARVEDEVLRWFAQWIGMPEGTGGLLTSGGSMANLSAIVAARDAAEATDLRTLRWYCSVQTHHSNHKAAHIAGLPAEACVVVPDDDGRISIPDLQAAIAADQAAGLQPFLVVGNAGTTDAGIIDDLDGLADTAHEAGLWFHADAAYGGFFALSPRCKPALQGLGRADSVTLDPHKGLGLPFGVGALLVRDPVAFAAGQAMRGHYMPPRDGPPEASDMGLELSRSWRGLRVWFPMMLHGLEAFRASIEHCLDMAQALADGLQAVPGIAVRGPSLSIVAFRPTSGSTRAMMERINNDGRVFVSLTQMDGHEWLRACIMNNDTGPEHVAALVELARP